MAHLVYIRGLCGPSPRIIFEADKAGNPVLDEAERGNVMATHRLTADEHMLVRDRRLALGALVRRYPPPRMQGDDGPACATPSPKPTAPSGGAAAKQLEVA